MVPTAPSDLAMLFESLGGTGHGCEFGIFQRDCGAEPLGLLRWSDLSQNALAQALETRFAGVGDAEYTVVFEPPPGNNDEWWTRDTRHHMAMRTFVPVKDVPYETMVIKARRRLQFLREKILNDLVEANKIFVYRIIFRDLRDDELARLHDAIRSYGNTVLLYVRYEDAEHPNGTVIVADKGLLIGYIDRFAFSPKNVSLGKATDSWLRICRKAVELRQSSENLRAADSVSGRPYSARTKMAVRTMAPSAKCTLRDVGVRSMSLMITGLLANAKNRKDFDYLQSTANENFDLAELVTQLTAYTGFLHPDPYKKLAQHISQKALSVGCVSTAAEVFSAPGRVSDVVCKAAGIQKFSYLPEAHSRNVEHYTICEEMPNFHRTDALPQRVSRRLHEPSCPALKCSIGEGLDLFVGPCAFQIIDRSSGGYIAQASSRPMSTAVFDAPQIRLGQTVVLIQDVFNGYNFAHFLFDWITRVGLLINSGVVAGRDAVFVFGGLPNEFHRLVINALVRTYGLSDENIFFPASDVLIQSPRTVFFSDHTHAQGHPAQMFRPEAVEVLRAVTRCMEIDRGAPQRRVYVSRGDVQRRAISNERDLLPVLERFGFDFVRLADLSIPRQMSLMARAEHVVGAHGMGLTHLAFNEGRPELIELHNPHVGTDAYAFMSKGLGFGYEPLVGVETGNENFRIDPAILESALARRMRSGTSTVWRAPPRSWRLSPPDPHWFAGVQKLPAQLTSDLPPPSAGNEVLLHRCDGRTITQDSNVGYWQLDRLASGYVYDFRCEVMIPQDFSGEAVSLSLAELGVQQTADLTRRGEWQSLIVTRTCPGNIRMLNLVLRVDSGGPCSIYSSRWQAVPAGLSPPDFDL